MLNAAPTKTVFTIHFPVKWRPLFTVTCRHKTKWKPNATTTHFFKTMIIKKKYNDGGCKKSVMQLAAAIIILVWLCSCIWGCSKTKFVDWNTYDNYSMVVDWHSLDTTKLIKRTQWNYDKVYKEKMKLDTAKDIWFIDCSMLDKLQHLYYLKNGKKIQESKYPK